MYSYQTVLQDRHRPLTMTNYVQGQYRPNYFKKPLVPQLSDVPVHLAQPESYEQTMPQQQQLQMSQEQQQLEQYEQQPKTRDVEVQTMYRDSEAQTDPYTPQYILKEGENPEVLQLEHLKFGKGLPATAEELDNIEINREKNWFDNALPPISDEACFNLRRKLMEVQEVKEWDKKELTIKKFQQEKLSLLQSGLIAREREVEEKNDSRKEDIRIKKLEQKNRLVAKITRRKVKVMRKMLKAKSNKQNPQNQRDIIQDYTNYASKVYAGITRDGLSLDKISNNYEYTPQAFNTFSGMTELADGIRNKEFESKIDIEHNLKQIKNNYTRLENYHKLQLKKAQQDIMGKVDQEKQNQEVINQRENDKKMQKKIRERTPNHSFVADAPGFHKVEGLEQADKYQEHVNKKMEQEKRQKAVIFLQRLLRGRYLQNIMYAGKEKRLALIEELLTVAKIEKLPEQEAEEILQQNHEETVKNAALEGIQGEIISETMDGLSKELLRMKQERKINAMVNVAEKDRRIREIHEAGKRQAEESLRQREDILYNEIMLTHKGTVDTYLDWIMSNTVEKASKRQATIMSNLRRNKLDKPLEKFERKFTNNETIIKDLVHSFLIPNVQRSKIQRSLEIAQKRFNEAAKKSIFTAVKSAKEKIQSEKDTKQKRNLQIIGEENQ